MSEVALASADEARALTNRIKVGLEGTYLLIQEAFASRAWEVLGYESWHEYVTAEFGSGGLRLPKAERAKAVELMRETGMSTRAIGSAIGVDDRTVRRDLDATAAFAAVEPDASPNLDQEEAPTVTGVNGKTYKAKSERARPRPKLTGQFETATRDLTKLVARFERLAADDRYPANRDVIASHLTPEIRRAAEVLAGLLHDLTNDRRDR